jgi:hypothetical protein
MTTFSDRRIIKATALVMVLIVAAGCGSLRTARIRKEVTINTFQDPGFKIAKNSFFAVLPAVRQEAGTGGFSYRAAEAAADMISLKLWDQGFRVIDKFFAKEVLARNEIEYTDISLNQAVYVGQALDADYVLIISLNDLEEDTRAVAFGPFSLVNTVDTSVLVGLHCRLIDVSAQRVIWSGAATTQDKNLQLSLRRIALQLIYTFHNGDGVRKPKDRAMPGLGFHY